MRKKTIPFLCIAAALSTAVEARRGAPETGPRQGALAVVAIPAYIDTTGSQNYGYLSGSLTDAVDSSMQQKFDYARANQKTVEGEAKKAWKANKVPSDAEIRQIAAATASDYVVVGSYTLSADKKQIIFNTRIFIAPDKFINVTPLANNADATLFDATNKVATEIVAAIEAEARARAAANQATVKAGEKIALSKTPDPAAPAAKTEDSDYQREKDRYIGVGVGYQTNAVERHIQFYQYPSAALVVNADLRITRIFRIYGRAALPQTPAGQGIPAAYKNNGNQTIGIEIGDRYGDYIFGLNYRNFSDVNPTGSLVRDLANWSASAYTNTNFRLFNLGPVYFGVDFDSYLDIYSTKVTGVTSDNIKMLWNLEGAATVSYFIPVISVSATALVGTAFSILDSTGQTLSSVSGTPAWDKVNRNGILTGVRYGLELRKNIFGIILKAEGFYTPSVAGKFQPLDEQNARRTSYAFANLSANYQFGF
ncbi:MAG: hypothetical protein KF713_08955 [Turneriella sp.]|nr:hypothetical protein [Turneriella sp.]